MVRQIPLLVAGLIFAISTTVGATTPKSWSGFTAENQDGKINEDMAADFADKNLNQKSKRVAIIGAGAAGASSAYYLRKALKEANLEGLPLEIVVYEREAFIGGRARTVDVYNDRHLPVEVGAAVFVAENYNLVDAANELGLCVDPWSVSEDGADLFAIFDGRKILFSMPDNELLLMTKTAFRYGPMSPLRVSHLAKATISKLLRLYDSPIFPFTSLTDAIDDAGLSEATAITGKQILKKGSISTDFAEEIVQATTRATYGQNIGLIHGLQTMVTMGIEGAMSIRGGNWRIFQRMLEYSDVDLRLSAAVTSITRDDDGKWSLTSVIKNEEMAREKFDEVILAGPLQYANITIQPEINEFRIPWEIPYATLHVTLFTSPKKLDPTYFGLEAGQIAPVNIFTTLNQTERADENMMWGRGKNGVGSVGFFSLTMLRDFLRQNESANGALGFRKEYLYKVFSPKPFDDDKVKAILGSEDNDDITWSHRRVWDAAYPYGYPRVKFDEIELTNGLWYTAGIESVLSTMETSSLMAKNVAKLIVQRWEEKLTGKKVEVPLPTEPTSDFGKESILLEFFMTPVGLFAFAAICYLAWYSRRLLNRYFAVL